ncbi:MAG: nrps1 [Labilithrix sp.]|nr:nrps1 [Labilithrix sp.]
MSTLDHAFSARAALAGDRLALADPEQRVTYRELLARASRAAAGIAELPGFAAGAHVGIAMHRSIEASVALLGTWLAGGVAVPIDPDWPAERRALVHDDAELVACLTEVASLAASDSAPPAHGRVGADLAAILYTSGSTGQPKGVCLSHGAFAARLAALGEAIPFEADDVTCLRTPPTFVDAFAELLGPLLHGVPSHVLPHPLRMEDLVTTLARERISRLLVTPTLLSVLLDARPDLGALAPALRLVVTSGERLDAHLAARFARAAPGARLVNVYGSTEVAGDATFSVVGTEAERAAPTIGRPLPGVHVEIVDARGTPARDGEVGEIVVSGAVVASGYWKRPELTDRRFSRGTGGERRFAMGDLGRRLPDGRLEVLGRTDQQAKIAGARVDLVEVERALLAHPAVRQAAVFVRTSLRGDARLCAAVATRSPVAETALRAHVGASLPRASVPATIEIASSLPTNEHGKIDRRLLALTPEAAGGLAEELAGLFAELTGAREVGLDDAFEASGGDSLALLRLQVELEARGVRVSPADLPAPLTPRTLASIVEAGGAAQARAASTWLIEEADRRVLDRTCADREDAFPVTDYQRAMVLDSRANRNSVWTDFAAFTMEGDIDPARLERAWRAVVAEEPALRTTMHWQGLSRVLQVVHRKATFSLRRVQMEALSAGEHRERLLAEEWRCMGLVFPLERAPLFEVTLVSGAAGHTLLFAYHHAILDGESSRLVLRRVLARYDAADLAMVRGESMRGVVEESLALDARALRAAEMLASHAASPEPADREETGGDLPWNTFHRALGLRSRMARWNVTLRTRLSSALRADHASAGIDPAAYAGGNVAEQALSVLHGRALAAWSARAGATVDATWAATYALLLARERRTNDVVFGVVVSGRGPGDAARIGMLANCLPLRIRIDPDERVADLAARVNRGLRELAAIARAPLFALSRAARLDPRIFLETLFVSWRYASSGTRRLTGGRSLTLCNTRLTLIVSQRDGVSHLGVASQRFHRAHHVRTHLAALSDALLTGEPGMRVSALLDLPLPAGALSFAVESV